MNALVGVEEAARLFGCHGDTVRRLIRLGRLPAVKLFGRWRIESREVTALLEKQRAASVHNSMEFVDTRTLREAARRVAAARNAGGGKR